MIFLLEELGAPYTIQRVETRNRDGTGAADPQKFDMAVRMTRITFPYLIMTLVAVQHAVTVHKHADSPELRSQLKTLFHDGTPPVDAPHA